MNRPLLFILYLLASTGIVYGQRTDRFLFSGIVVNSNHTKEVIPQVHILHKKGLGTITNNKGYFSIYVNNNDSLVFNHIGYNAHTIVVEATTLGNNYIFLKPDTIKIKEVEVFPFQNYVEFTRLFINMPIRYDQEIFNAESNIALCLYQARSGTSIEGNAEDYTNRSIQKLSNSVIYSGQISPQNLINLNPLTIGYSLFSSRKKRNTEFFKAYKKSQNQFTYLSKKKIVI